MENTKAKDYLFHTWIEEDFTIKTENGNITVLELLEHFEEHLHQDKSNYQTTQLREQNERLNKAMLDSAYNLIQFVAVELRGEKLSDEDIESMIHDYVHPKNETKKE